MSCNVVSGGFHGELQIVGRHLTPSECRGGRRQNPADEALTNERIKVERHPHNVAVLIPGVAQHESRLERHCHRSGTSAIITLIS